MLRGWKKLVSAIGLGLVALLALPALAAASTPWEYIGTYDGVKVSRRQEPGSDLFSFRGEIVANVSIGKLVSVFVDRDQRKHWVDRYDDSKTIERPAPLSEIYWIKFALPFPVSNRDYVLRADGSLDTENRVFKATIKSVVDSRKPNDDCCVRALAKGTYYRFTALPGTPERTKLEVEVNTDPKGALPDWLINLIQKKWPSKTLSGLLNRVSKVSGSTTPYPGLENWHVPAAPAAPTP